MDVNSLWHSLDSKMWERAIDYYDRYILTDHVRALDKELDPLDLQQLAKLDAVGWYTFLRNKYFPWKYTARNRLVTTCRSLDKCAQEKGLDFLLSIREELLAFDPENTRQGLLIATKIGGLGSAGASGLLALMYPKYFGTVDVFLVAALSQIHGLQEADRISRLEARRRRAAENPKLSFSLSINDALMLILIMQRKARENNETLGTQIWTPRRVDKALWACGHL